MNRVRGRTGNKAIIYTHVIYTQYTYNVHCTCTCIFTCTCMCTCICMCNMYSNMYVYILTCIHVLACTKFECMCTNSIKLSHFHCNLWPKFFDLIFNTANLHCTCTHNTTVYTTALCVCIAYTPALSIQCGVYIHVHVRMHTLQCCMRQYTVWCM